MHKLREGFIILVTRERFWKHNLNSLLWMGSKAQIEDFILVIT